MISRTDLEAELKRYPQFIKAALLKKDYGDAYKLQIELSTIQWILESE